ncbi:TetR/AcrR family transcriptional regulator [Paramicrobacterium agarici]|uniref:TetR family transcriptional regulator n=1 Tax=Paramicrobacterium agarici TaxID=630514 RepID=A0A2A9DX22_9MICO|nr:TetR/AcrR family transcriptional regulator C-terminal domain-containing protein [Microbacterium agarici]PFG30926.1 TetR family transcriptional regulator [Microbacterium agarici]
MSDDLEGSLPRAVAMAWGIAADPQRGPKRGLSIEKIVETGIEIADEGGLETVSMSAIANRLDFTTMSLYRYVSAKDDLIVLMGEQALGVPPERPDPPLPWREAARRLAAEMFAAYCDHPWLIDVPITGIPVTPNQLAWMDEGLGCFEGTSLDHEKRIAVTLMLSGLTRWKATVYRGYTAESAAQGTTPDDLDATANHIIRELLTNDRFPHLAPAVAADAMGPAAADPFDFGIDALLNGVEAYMSGIDAGEAVEEPSALAHPESPRDKDVREASRVRREAEAALREARRKEAEAMTKARERAMKREEAKEKAAKKR